MRPNSAFAQRILLPLLPVASLACVDVGSTAGEPELLLPDPVSVTWEAAYDDEGDGLGALIPVDLMTYDGESGEPVAAIELVVWVPAGAAWPVPAGEVVMVNAEDCYGCEPLLWDAQSDEYLLMPPVSESLTLETDHEGLARLYVYVDSFPEGSAGSDRDFGDLSVVVVMGDTEQSFMLLPR